MIMRYVSQRRANDDYAHFMKVIRNNMASAETGVPVSILAAAELRAIAGRLRD